MNAGSNNGKPSWTLWKLKKGGAAAFAAARPLWGAKGSVAR